MQIHIVEYYAAIQWNQAPVHKLHNTWMNRKHLMLSEKSQTQKATYYLIPFGWHSGKKTKL